MSKVDTAIGGIICELERKGLSRLASHVGEQDDSLSSRGATDLYRLRTCCTTVSNYLGDTQNLFCADDKMFYFGGL